MHSYTVLEVFTWHSAVHWFFGYVCSSGGDRGGRGSAEAQCRTEGWREESGRGHAENFWEQVSWQRRRVVGKGGCRDAVASRLWNCGNSAKCIYGPHKWKVSVPVCPRKMRTARIWKQLVQPFKKKKLCYNFVGTITRHYLCGFLWLVSCS